jgi:hypothetical protein
MCELANYLVWNKNVHFNTLVSVEHHIFDIEKVAYNKNKDEQQLHREKTSGAYMVWPVCYVCNSVSLNSILGT